MWSCITWISSKSSCLYHWFTLIAIYISWWRLDTAISTTAAMTRPTVTQFLVTVILRPWTFLFYGRYHLIWLLVIKWFLWNEWVWNNHFYVIIKFFFCCCCRNLKMYQEIIKWSVGNCRQCTKVSWCFQYPFYFIS